MVYQLLFTLSLLGVVLSLYALRVEHLMGASRQYRPLCDISKKVTCTKIFGSRYGHLLVVSNAFIGVLFYFLIFLLAFYEQMTIVLYLSFFAVLGSVYLFYLATFKLKKFCVVCTLVYLLNFALLVMSFLVLYVLPPT